MLMPYTIALLLLFLFTPLASSTSRSDANPFSQTSQAHNIDQYPNYDNIHSWELAATNNIAGFLDSNYGVIFINRSSASYSSSFHPSSFSDIGGLFADSTTGLFGVFYSCDNQITLATINPRFANYSITNISLPSLAATCNTTKSPVAAVHANGAILFSFCNMVLAVHWGSTATATTIAILPHEIEHGYSWVAYDPVSRLAYFTASEANPTSPVHVVVINVQSQSVSTSFSLDKNATNFVGPLISVDPTTNQAWLLTSSNTFTRFDALGTTFANFTTDVHIYGLGVDSRDGQCYVQCQQYEQGQSFVLQPSQDPSSSLDSYPYSGHAIYGLVFIDPATNLLWGTDALSRAPAFISINNSDLYHPSPAPTPTPYIQPVTPSPPIGGMLTARVTQTVQGRLTLFKPDKYSALLANLLSIPVKNVSCDVTALTADSGGADYSVTSTFALYTTNINQDHSLLAKEISIAIQSVTARGYFVQECAATLKSTSTVEMLVLTRAQDSESSPVLDYSLAIGLGVGLGVGIPVVGLIISFVIYKRRRSSYKVGVTLAVPSDSVHKTSSTDSIGPC